MPKVDIKIGTLAVCKRQGTKYYDLYKKIIDFTDFLDEDSSFRERVYYYEQNKKEIEKCECGCGVKLKTPWKFKYIQGHSNRSDVVKNKKIETFKEKYGVINAGQLEEVKLKRENTNIKKYGEKYPILNKEFKEKQKNDFKEKWGVDNPSKLDWVRKKISENVLKTREHCKDKIRKDILKTQYKKLLTPKRLINIIPLFSESDYIGHLGVYDFQCGVCNSTFKSDLQDGKIPRCYTCNPRIDSGGQSIMEKELIEYIKTLESDIIEQDRKLIYPLELDVILPEKFVAIEFNGLYWHSELSGKKNRFYHIKKTELCNQKGFRLIQIFEDEWLYKKQIVKNRLKSILGKQKYKIYARKCEIKQISPQIKNKFLNKYHIQGEDRSNYHLGLFFKNRLVSVMTFSQLRPALGQKPKENEWELVRYCSNFNFNVIGGASKLLKHFENDKNSKSIISYADLRWSEGNLYKKLGFDNIGKTLPNYWYLKNETIYKRHHRYGFQKGLLKEKLKNFDDTLSEWENMQNNGYDRIWDCGHLKFVKFYTKSDSN